MRYWDTSAIVPVVVDEPGTKLVRELLETDPSIVTWTLTWVELCGAVERRARQGSIDARSRRILLQRFTSLSKAWDEVVEVDAVRTRAVSLLARHSVRAADALQLASAAVLAEGDPTGLEFVCLDRNLADAADREGFRVRTWPDD
jgi:predicted nucleic acid-binding protein